MVLLRSSCEPLFDAPAHRRMICTPIFVNTRANVSIPDLHALELRIRAITKDMPGLAQDVAEVEGERKVSTAATLQPCRKTAATNPRVTAVACAVLQGMGGRYVAPVHRNIDRRIRYYERTFIAACGQVSVDLPAFFSEYCMYHAVNLDAEHPGTYCTCSRLVCVLTVFTACSVLVLSTQHTQETEAALNTVLIENYDVMVGLYARLGVAPGTAVLHVQVLLLSSLSGCDGLLYI